MLQGVGGAFLFANAAAIVTDAFPREQLGLAMGTNTMVAAVGLVIGPVLGGALVAIGWQWVFWFNVPLGLARQRCGRRSSCASSASATRSAASTSLGTLDLSCSASTGARARALEGRADGLERPAS